MSLHKICYIIMIKGIENNKSKNNVTDGVKFFKEMVSYTQL
jgi:hypothetical protein